MHVQTHIMSGWCVGNCFSLGARERLFCMIAAAFPDLDGLSRLFGQEAYWDWHHVLLHNLLAGVAVSTVLAVCSTRRLAGLLVYLVLFHLHLVLDYFGSGPGWGLAYCWPFSRFEFVSWGWWDLYSWQNTTAGLLLLAWTVVIAVRKRRTPLELLIPSLDRQLAELVSGKRQRDAEHTAEA